MSHVMSDTEVIAELRARIAGLEAELAARDAADGRVVPNPSREELGETVFSAVYAALRPSNPPKWDRMDKRVREAFCCGAEAGRDALAPFCVGGEGPTESEQS